jgi:hypothetical protein
MNLTIDQLHTLKEVLQERRGILVQQGNQKNKIIKVATIIEIVESEIEQKTL